MANAFEVNTNLEQISDWLTKILVGVGLVELGQIAAKGAELVAFVAPSLDGNKSAALGLLIFFSVAGFLLGYLATRLRLGLPLDVQANRRVLSDALALYAKYGPTRQNPPEQDTSPLPPTVSAPPPPPPTSPTTPPWASMPSPASAEVDFAPLPFIDTSSLERAAKLRHLIGGND
jgi:hypothetical protein